MFALIKCTLLLATFASGMKKESQLEVTDVDRNMSELLTVNDKTHELNTQVQDKNEELTAKVYDKNDELTTEVETETIQLLDVLQQLSLFDTLFEFLSTKEVRALAMMNKIYFQSFNTWLKNINKTDLDQRELRKIFPNFHVNSLFKSGTGYASGMLFVPFCLEVEEGRWIKICDLLCSSEIRAGFQIDLSLAFEEITVTQIHELVLDTEYQSIELKNHNDGSFKIRRNTWKVVDTPGVKTGSASQHVGIEEFGSVAFEDIKIKFEKDENSMGVNDRVHMSNAKEIRIYVKPQFSSAAELIEHFLKNLC